MSTFHARNLRHYIGRTFARLNSPPCAALASTAIAGRALAVGALLAVSSAGMSVQAHATDASAEPRAVKVALIAYSPFCDVADSNPSGIEPSMLGEMASRLNLDLQYSVSDFAGQVASVQAGRNDLAICLFYWKKDRTPTGIYTDPVLYAPIQVMQLEGGTVSSVEDMEGKTIGSITGYSWNDALKAIPGATVRLYPEYPALLADLAAGRVDVAPADALVNDAAMKQRPDWKLQVSDLKVPTAEQIAAHPEFQLLRPSQIAWYLNTSQKELAEQLTAQIREMYADGSMAELLTKHGVANPSVWLTPPGEYIAAQRHGVDRPEGWQPPSMGQ